MPRVQEPYGLCRTAPARTGRRRPDLRVLNWSEPNAPGWGNLLVPRCVGRWARSLHHLIAKRRSSPVCDRGLGGAAAIQAAFDVLHVTADITGNREPAKAADSYDRAAREPYGRLPPVTPYGSALRAVARTLAVTNVRWGDRREHKRNLTVDLLFLIAN